MYLSRKQSLSIAVTMLFAFFGAALIAIKGSNKEGKERSSLPIPSVSLSEDGSPSLVLNRFNRSLTRDGRKVWEVDAEKGEYIVGSDSAKISNAVLHLYKEDGVVVRLDAPTATLYLKENNLTKAELNGGITVNYGGQFTVVTDFALYDQQREVVTAPGLTKIKGDGFDVQGDELSADVNQRILHLKGNVISVFTPKKDGTETHLPRL